MIIIQQNLDRKNKKVKTLMETLLEKNPDIIFFSEFCYANHKVDVVDRLSENYEIILPFEFNENDMKNRNLTSACMLAVKKESGGSKFKPRSRANIQQKYRYIEGTYTDKDYSIECFFAYVQQLYVDKRNVNKYKEVDDYLEKAEKKANMLFEMYRFSQENKSKNFFIGGDLNTDINRKNARMRFIFSPLYEEVVDTYNYPTWKGQHLDYALISKSLNDQCQCTTISIETNSDHLALCTEIKQVNIRPHDLCE